MMDWHRLFGLSLVDFFHNLPVTVELEKDLSLKQQFLDVVILRKEKGPLPIRLPDGLEDLTAHNLITFKSHQEQLDAWSLEELIGHYVNYRKQSSPSLEELLPESEIRLYAVCVRSPQRLAREMELTAVQAGVYETRQCSRRIRVIVVHELPMAEQNAMLLLFSNRPALVQYGMRGYHQQARETSTLLIQLFQRYGVEGTTMQELLQEWERLKDQTVADLLKGLPVEERLKGLPAEERLKGLSAEEIRNALPAKERMKGLSVDEILESLPAAMRSALAERLKE